MAEDSGLAERSIDGKRTTVANLDEKMLDVEVELELRRTRLDHVQDELDAQRSASTPPKRDPLADITVLQEREKMQVVMKEGKVYIDRRPGHARVEVVPAEPDSWRKIDA